MTPPRKFNWDEAKRLRAFGLSYRDIGRYLGVSSTAIARACDPEFRRRQDAASKKSAAARLSVNAELRAARQSK